MYRTLTYYWRTYLAVALGAAVASAVLAGAFMVGDSVRGSLRDLTLDRLGRIDRALVADRFFRESLAGDLAAEDVAAVPAIVARGAASDPASGSRASRIGIYGIDERFTRLFGEDGVSFERQVGQVFPSVVINESLRRELGVEPGQSILLSFGRFSEVPRETLLGETGPDEVLGTLRGTVTAVIPDRGMGRFALTPRQRNPFNAFVELKQLQRSLDQRDRINAMFATEAGPGSSGPDAVLPEVLRLQDLGLTVRKREGHVTLESSERVIRPVVDRAVAATVADLGAPALDVQSYLLNRMQVGDRTLPYSLVAALDPLPGQPWASLVLADGSPAPRPGERGILLHTWAARELGASVGDPLEATYYVVGPREELREERATFRVEGIVALSGLGADRTLTPDYPGIQDADDIADWDPPFPVDLERIRPQDETYWDDHGAAPKAFVSAETGRELWSTRFGHATSVRVGLRAGDDAEALERALRHGLLLRLPLDAFGMSFRPVREEGLRAASGATDFAGLFLGFSLFLIVSAGLLVGLLFRLGVEQRAREVGLLLAVGYRVRSIRLRMLLEAVLLAGAGAVVGVVGGLGYAWLMMAALRTVWLPAVGSSELYLHVAPLSPVLGWVVAVAVVLLSVAGGVRALTRVEPTRLLAGDWRDSGSKRSGRVTRAVAVLSLLVALALAATALATGASESPGLAFGTGALLLVSGLAWFALWCRGAARRGLFAGQAVLAGMAARNSSWNPGRSILSVALVACASFVIVTVAANREEPGRDAGNKRSGSGGFRLVAESDVPLLQDLNDSEGRFDLGFGERESAALQGARVFPFRLLPGDDTSCLNLYRPEKPRLLGVGRSFVERGGFDFQQVLGDVEDPWSLLEQPLEPGVIPAIGDFNSVLWILHLGLGQELTLEDAFGEPVRLRLVALLRGSVFQSELLISEADFLRHFPDTSGDAYFLIDTPAGRESEIASVLEKRLARFGFDATTTREKLAGYKIVEHTYLSTFQLLGGFGLLLGTVGLGVVLVRNVIERRRELATLRAFGFPRARLAWLVLAENLFLLLAGVAIGSLTALAAIAPRLAHIHVPWTSLSLTLLVVLLVGTAAGAAAVRGVIATALLPSLKQE